MVLRVETLRDSSGSLRAATSSSKHFGHALGCRHTPTHIRIESVQSFTVSLSFLCCSSLSLSRSWRTLNNTLHCWGSLVLHMYFRIPCAHIGFMSQELRQSLEFRLPACRPFQRGSKYKMKQRLGVHVHHSFGLWASTVCLGTSTCSFGSLGAAFSFVHN